MRLSRVLLPNYFRCDLYISIGPARQDGIISANQNYVNGNDIHMDIHSLLLCYFVHYVLEVQSCCLVSLRVSEQYFMQASFIDETYCQSDEYVSQQPFALSNMFVFAIISTIMVLKINKLYLLSSQLSNIYYPKQYTNH